MLIMQFTDRSDLYQRFYRAVKHFETNKSVQTFPTGRLFKCCTSTDTVRQSVASSGKESIAVVVRGTDRGVI
jgi:hypothetical protein